MSRLQVLRWSHHISIDACYVQVRVQCQNMYATWGSINRSIARKKDEPSIHTGEAPAFSHPRRSEDPGNSRRPSRSRCPGLRAAQTCNKVVKHNEILDCGAARMVTKVQPSLTMEEHHVPARKPHMPKWCWKRLSFRPGDAARDGSRCGDLHARARSGYPHPTTPGSGTPRPCHPHAGVCPRYCNSTSPG